MRAWWRRSPIPARLLTRDWRFAAKGRGPATAVGHDDKAHVNRLRDALDDSRRPMDLDQFSRWRA